MSLYAAIDLHSSNSVLAVLDGKDYPLRQRRLPNHLPTILKELEPFHDEVEGIVVQSTYNWYWLVDGLQDHGYRVHLAHTAAVPQYSGLVWFGRCGSGHPRIVRRDLMRDLTGVEFLVHPQ